MTRRYGEMMKMRVDKARARITMNFKRDGSMAEQNIETRCTGIEARLLLDSPEPPDRVAELVRNVEAGCFILQTMRQPVPVDLSASLNDATLPLAP